MKFKEMQMGTSTNVTTVVAFSTAAFFMPIALCMHGKIIRNIRIKGNGRIRMTALHCIAFQNLRYWKGKMSFGFGSHCIKECFHITLF
jgi:hypothetical protein